MKVAICTIHVRDAFSSIFDVVEMEPESVKVEVLNTSDVADLYIKAAQEALDSSLNESILDAHVIDVLDNDIVNHMRTMELEQAGIGKTLIALAEARQRLVQAKENLKPKFYDLKVLLVQRNSMTTKLTSPDEEALQCLQARLIQVNNRAVAASCFSSEEVQKVSSDFFLRIRRLLDTIDTCMTKDRSLWRTPEGQNACVTLSFPNEFELLRLSEPEYLLLRRALTTPGRVVNSNLYRRGFLKQDMVFPNMATGKYSTIRLASRASR